LPKWQVICNVEQLSQSGRTSSHRFFLIRHVQQPS
jgi:hypothetical protein